MVPTGGSGDLTLVLLANAPEHRDTVLTFLTSTLGINLAWLFDQRFAPGVVRPFHTVLQPFVIIPTVGVVFLLLARRAVVSRPCRSRNTASAGCLRGSIACSRGSTTAMREGSSSPTRTAAFPKETPLPGEKRRGNLGRVNYLIRIVVVLESPILAVSVISAGFDHETDFTTLGTLGLILWPIGLLIVFVRAAGLIAAEKARADAGRAADDAPFGFRADRRQNAGLAADDGDRRGPDHLSNAADRVSSPVGRAFVLRSRG